MCVTRVIPKAIVTAAVVAAGALAAGGTAFVTHTVLGSGASAVAAADNQGDGQDDGQGDGHDLDVAMAQSFGAVPVAHTTEAGPAAAARKPYAAVQADGLEQKLGLVPKAMRLPPAGLNGMPVMAAT
ncbi:hypothetical protein [Streptomyces sp. NPDC001594]|uniref:hypothetical protein n=1 Tax=Streptomyces sp. NPDC001594 TaxID=3364590 RepID=UPI00367A67F7